MKKFVSIDLENPRFTVYKLLYWLWERLNEKKGTFVRRLVSDPPPPCVVPRLEKFLTPLLLMYALRHSIGMQKSINFVFNKSKYRRDSRKIDPKCTKKCFQIFSPAAPIGTADKYFKI